MWDGDNSYATVECAGSRLRSKRRRKSQETPFPGARHRATKPPMADPELNKLLGQIRLFLRRWAGLQSNSRVPLIFAASNSLDANMFSDYF